MICSSSAASHGFARDFRARNNIQFTTEKSLTLHDENEPAHDRHIELTQFPATIMTSSLALPMFPVEHAT